MIPVAISAIAMSFRTVEEGATLKLNRVRSTAYETMKSMQAITLAAFTIAGVIQYGKNLLGIVLASAETIRGWCALDSTPAAQAFWTRRIVAPTEAG
jgi:hypothetical protein